MDKEEISIVRIIKALQEYKQELLLKWKLLVFFILLFAGLGIVVSLVKQPKYIAKTTLMLQNDKGGGGVLSGYLQMAGQLGILPGGTEAIDEDKVLEIFKSRRIIESALYKKATIDGKNDFMCNHYISIYELRKKFDADDDLKGFVFKNGGSDKHTFLEDSLIYVFHESIVKNCLKLTKDPKSGIIEIQLEFPSELFSKYFCEFMVDALKEYYLSNKTQKERESLAIIQNRVDSITGALNNSEDRYAKWKDSYSRLIKVQGSIEGVKMQREVTILNVMYAEAAKNLEIAKFNLLLSTPIVQVIDSPILPLEKKKFRKLYGLILGGFLGGFLSFGYFILKKIISKILTEEKSKENN